MDPELEKTRKYVDTLAYATEKLNEAIGEASLAGISVDIAILTHDMLSSKRGHIERPVIILRASQMLLTTK